MQMGLPKEDLGVLSLIRPGLLHSYTMADKSLGVAASAPKTLPLNADPG